MINEAEGYYQERTNEADGDTALFEAVSKIIKIIKILQEHDFFGKYGKSPYNISDKIVIDTKIEGVLHF